MHLKKVCVTLAKVNIPPMKRSTDNPDTGIPTQQAIAYRSVACSRPVRCYREHQSFPSLQVVGVLGLTGSRAQGDGWRPKSKAIC